ncbi:hypothetical protein KAR10_00485 [bacterium]|nr:hypothetical protein [bacterium]
MMKKKKLNQRRYRQGEEPVKREVIPEEAPDQIMLEHIQEMVSLIEGSKITLEEARELAQAARKKRETTPP